jgi:hypothetical protein
LSCPSTELVLSVVEVLGVTVEAAGLITD